MQPAQRLADHGRLRRPVAFGGIACDGGEHVAQSEVPDDRHRIAFGLTGRDRQDVTGGVEVIVVDNASTDATAAIARANGAIVVREERPGVCFARQAGTSAARPAPVSS